MKTNCLPRGNRSSFWAFCSSRLTFFLKWDLWMILFKKKQSSRPAFRKSGNYCLQLIAKIFIHPLNRPSPLLGSITLPPRENQNKMVTFLNHTFQKKWWFHVSNGNRLSQLSIERGLGIPAGSLGTCVNCPRWFDSTSWKYPAYLVILVLVKSAFVSSHDFLSISAQRIRQLVIIELSSCLPSRAYF